MSFSQQNEIEIGTKLYKAAVEGRFEEFERFADSLDRFVNSIQDTILHIHLKSEAERSAEFVKKVLGKCPQLLTQVNENGDTPLHIAARNNRSEMARLLIQLAKTRDLESGQEAVAEARKMIRMVNKNEDTALHEAVWWDNVDVVEEILEAEDLTYKYGVNNSGETPLYLAAHCCSVDSLHAILEVYELKPVAYEGPSGKTVLHAAVVYCSRWEVSEVIERMEGLANQADKNGWTPLHYAVCRPRYYSSTVSTILEKDTRSAYMKDKDRKRTPIHLAACLGNLDALNIFMSVCPDCAELTDYRGWNACHFAAISKTSEALQLILETSSLAHLGKCRDNNGYSPIELYFFSTYNPSYYFWDLNKYDRIFNKLRGEPPDEISEKKEMIEGWTKELGNGPNGEIVAGKFVVPMKESTEEEVLDMYKDDERIIQKMEKAKDSNLVASALVATVTFAAAFTVPGGYISDEGNSNGLKLGTPILSRDAAFGAFVITNGIALVLSTCSVFVHFMMSLAGYRHKYVWLTSFASWFAIFSMGAMVVAFVTGTYAVLAPNSFKLAILTCLIGLIFFPFAIFVFTRLVKYEI